MTPTLRRFVTVLCALAVLACLGPWPGRTPSRAVEVPPLPSLPLPTLPLPSIDLGTPLPSIDLGTPLPSIDLGTPLPSIDLGTPLPSIDLGTPLPSIPSVGSSSGASPSVSPEASQEASGSATPTPDASDGSALPRRGNPPTDEPPAARLGAEERVSRGAPSVPELVSLAPALPTIGSWLIPSLGATVPALILALFLGLQLVGGAAAVRLARRTLDRLASAAPAWLRS